MINKFKKTMEEFNIRELNKNGISVLYLDGYLDAHTSIELEKAFEKLLKNENFRIIVNFEKLSYISSAGLGVFMAFIETVRNNKGDIKLCSMSDKIFNIFDMLGFPVLFDIAKDEVSAVNSFN
jgi:anti-sigma B factor antagonist